MSVIARFEIHFTRHLDAGGALHDEPPATATDPDRLREVYRWMVLTRTYDARCVALQRTGRLGTYASSLGQEAVGVCLGSAMDGADVLLPSYREAGAQLCRGVRMEELMLYWGGDERGMDYRGPREDFPICIPIGTQTTQAAGVACAFRLRGEPRVAVCACGDGATSRGDFYEALNLAGVWRLPVVFVVSNNQWAISVPRAHQSAAQTLAQKALAAGVPGEQVDGNDAVALLAVLDRALEQARAGTGPALVEALTYRLGDHTTADDATRYRPAGEVARHRPEEPLIRLRRYLESLGAWSGKEEAALEARCRDAVEAATEAYLSLAPLPPEAMFEHLYATLPASLERQRAAAADWAHEHE